MIHRPHPLRRIRSGPLLSVRFSLLFWNTGLLTLSLLGFCVCCRTLVRIGLLAILDKQLTTRTQGLVRYWEQMPTGEREILRQQLGARRSGGGLLSLLSGRFVLNSATTPLNGLQEPTYAPRILTLQGIDYFTQNRQTPWDTFAFARAARGEAVLTTIPIGAGPARVFSLPVRIDGRVQVVVQTARDLGEYERQLQTITNDLFATIPFLLLLSAGGGLLLTHRALKPVRALREATARIEAEDLSQRLPVSGHDEFAQLTTTFNHMLARLELAFTQQARFIADASHELRTPLTILRGNTSLALSQPRSAEEYKSTLERAHRTAETMSRLVEELLLLSQADSDQLLRTPERVQLRDLLLAAIEATPRPESAPITLQDCDDLLYVMGNPGLLTRLFANLLHNAVRHTPPRKPITITAVSHAGCVVTQVEDSGEGIAAEHLPYVCDRFYRVDAARAPQQGGSGLGLAICRSIVEAHGGTIHLQSVVGHGTTVTVVLPIA